MDDATSRIQAARFVAAETTAGYMALVGSAKSPLTQFGRTLGELGIEGICANSPQAKGRMERANGSCRIGWSNSYAWPASPPEEPENAHAPVCPAEQLRGILCQKESRKLSWQLTCQYHQQWLASLRPKVGSGLVGAQVEIRAHLDGKLEVHQGDRVLAYE